MTITTFEAWTNTWKGYVQSGGWTMGAWDNMIFKPIYASFSTEAHSMDSRIQWTAAWKGSQNWPNGGAYGCAIKFGLRNNWGPSVGVVKATKMVLILSGPLQSLLDSRYDPVECRWRCRMRILPDWGFIELSDIGWGTSVTDQDAHVGICKTQNHPKRPTWKPEYNL